MKKLGSIQSMSFELNEPKMAIEDMELKQLMILVGANGTGKTFVLTLTWVINTFVNAMLLSRVHKAPFNDKEILQFFFDNSFSNNNLDGKIKFVYSGADAITVILEKGKVVDIYDFIDTDVDPPGQPTFMSKETRLLEAVIKYMKFKKAIGLPSGMPANESNLLKLLDMYRIYDVMYMEQLLNYIEHRTSETLITGFNTRMKEFDDKFSIQGIRVDYTTSDIIYKNDTGTEQSVATLGAGHQSLMNMIIFQEYNAVQS